MILCGNFRQLPPVRACPCYSMPINQLVGPILWHSTGYFPLVRVVRQTDERFLTILTKIGDRLKLSIDEITLIQFRHESESSFRKQQIGASAKIKCRPHLQSKPNTLSPKCMPVYKKVVNITLAKTVKCKRKQFS